MRSYEQCSEFVQSLLRTGVALVSVLCGIVAADLYVAVLQAFALIFNAGEFEDLEVVAFGFEGFLLAWATIASTAAMLYRRLGASNEAAEMTKSDGLVAGLQYVAIAVLIWVHAELLRQRGFASPAHWIGLGIVLAVLARSVYQGLRRR